MIFYHFTAKEWLPNIAREGLTRGEVPLTQRETLNAVWLTTDKNPDGHGLTDGGPISDEDKKFFGLPLDREFSFPNKRAVRFSVVMPSADRNLDHWPRWAKKRLSKQWYDSLSSTGGKKDKTWWLYWGVIPTSALRDATDMETGERLIGWPDAWLQQEAVQLLSAPRP